jgi:hypothetical protein
MATNDDFLPAPDVDVDAERFVDPDDEELDVPTTLDHPTEGSIADVLDQHRAVPIDDDME